jgi:hypothetical protein
VRVDVIEAFPDETFPAGSAADRALKSHFSLHPGRSHIGAEARQKQRGVRVWIARLRI